MTVHSLRDRALLVTPIRLGLGFVWLFAARLSGALCQWGLPAPGLVGQDHASSRFSVPTTPPPRRSQSVS